MRPIQVRTLAEHLMHEHGLLDLEWRSVFDARFTLNFQRRR